MGPAATLTPGQRSLRRSEQRALPESIRREGCWHGWMEARGRAWTWGTLYGSARHGPQHTTGVGILPCRALTSEVLRDTRTSTTSVVAVCRARVHVRSDGSRWGEGYSLVGCSKLVCTA